MLNACLGTDLLVTWLCDERKRLGARDIIAILRIVLVAAVFGFLTALFLGAVAAPSVFVLSQARLNVVRLRSTVATRRSLVKRPDADPAVLSRNGSQISLDELTGCIVFGTVHTLVEQPRGKLRTEPRPQAILIDFARLNGFDATTAFALERYENEILQRSGGSTTAQEKLSLLDLIQKLSNRNAIPKALTRVTLAKGETLINEGSLSRGLFVLEKGSMRAEVLGVSGEPLAVVRFLPGALLSKIVYYFASVPRAASVIAKCPSTMFRIEPDLIAK